MPQQRILDSQVWCPLSGFKMKDGIVEPHKIPLLLCVGGTSLFARCTHHICKVFIQDALTVQKVLEQSTVVRVKERWIRKDKVLRPKRLKKEKENGQA